MPRETELTSFGPGKFDTLIDSLAYDLIKDENAGDVSEIGFIYTLLRGIDLRDIEGETDVDMEELSDGDKAFIRAHKAGIIFYEDDQGIVVSWFSSKKELDKVWKRAQDEVNEAYKSL